MWIRTIDPEQASGTLRRIYDAAVRRAGRVFQIVRAMSLAPDTLEASLALYQRVMLAPGALARRQREMLAVVVSRANDCHY
ncbi:MAG TPA: carboxymuconolactone decarboxylase family protein [Planctomycetota bacterium]